MKRLRHYEDGTLRVVYDNGAEGILFSGVRDIEIKILVKANERIFTIPICGGLPSEIKNEKEARWMRLSGSSVGELVYKALVNFGVTVAHTVNDKAFRLTYKCLKLFRPTMCGEDKV